MFARTFARRAARFALRSTRGVVTRSAARQVPRLAAGLFASAAVGSAVMSNQAFCAEQPLEGVPGTATERTFIAVKPDGVQRGLVGKIIQRFEEKGYKLVALKLLTPTKEMAEAHYSDLSTKPFFGGLTKFFSSGPIVAMVWEGTDAIRTGRRMLGETDPNKSAPGSIRGDFCINIGRNIIHGSDGPEGAAHEINFWFDKSEVYDWTPENRKWIYEK